LFSRLSQFPPFLLFSAAGRAAALGRVSTGTGGVRTEGLPVVSCIRLLPGPLSLLSRLYAARVSLLFDFA